MAASKVDRAGHMVAYSTRAIGLLGVINFFVLLDLGREPNPIILTTVGALVATGEAVDRVVKSIKLVPRLPPPREEDELHASR